MKGIDTDEMNCDTCIIIQEILSDEIEDEELLFYIAKGNLNIRIHRNITGEMGFGVG